MLFGRSTSIRSLVERLHTPRLLRCVCLVGLLAAGCRLPNPAPTGAGSGPNPAFADDAERLAAVEVLLLHDRVDDAALTLEPLLAGKFKRSQVKALKAEIDRRLAVRHDREVLAGALYGSDTTREHRELLHTASKKLEDIYELLERGKLAEAERALQPFKGRDLFVNEVAELASEVERRKALQLAKSKQVLLDHEAMMDVETRLHLPEKYNKVIVISRETENLDIPPGPMEELVSRKVSMRLEGAGIKDLVLELSKIDDLNVIMDEALTEEQMITISVTDVPLSELLSYVARNMGVAFHLGENTVWVTESIEPPGTGPALDTRIFKIQQGFVPSLGDGMGGDTELEDALEAVFDDSPDGATYRLFRTRNLLMVKNSREKMREVTDILKEFDKAPLQVLIESRFVTVSHTDLTRIGMQLGTVLYDIDDDRPISGVDAVTNVLDNVSQGMAGEDLRGLDLTVSGILGQVAYEALVHALNKTESVRNLSAPRTTVVNNQAAQIRKGDTTYYWEEWESDTQQVVDAQGQTRTVTTPRPSGSPTELELGITLDVAVNIGNDGKTVMLALEPEITELLSFFTYGTTQDPRTVTEDAANQQQNQNDDEATGYQVPNLRVSTIKTSVVVNSGETVVLGGMIETRKSTGLRKIPFLGDIPILGHFFRHEEEVEEPQHLLIFVTASVIAPSGEFVDYQPTPPADDE